VLASTFVAWAERGRTFDETQLCEIVDACGEQSPENDGFTSNANSVDRALRMDRTPGEIRKQASRLNILLRRARLLKQMG
jgi:hypothetical protein